MMLENVDLKKVKVAVFDFDEILFVDDKPENIKRLSDIGVISVLAEREN